MRIYLYWIYREETNDLASRLALVDELKGWVCVDEAASSG
jgi:hypothetical protein